MSLSKELLNLLSCPKCNGKLIDREKFIVCADCKEKFPIEDGVPNLL